METILDEAQLAIPETSVVANVIVYRNADGSHVVQIYEWSSLKPGKGETNKALACLRRQYPGIITAHDCGNPGDESYAYWQHQLAKERIDFAYDDNGDDIDTAG